jgi:hypothetical protein
MPWSVDARIPVRFGSLENAPAGVALLVEGDAPIGAGVVIERFTVPVEAPHPVGCICCAARSPAAQALARLFLTRARGEVEMFCEVVVVATPEGEAVVRATLEGDPLVSAWFRLAAVG